MYMYMYVGRNMYITSNNVCSVNRHTLCMSINIHNYVHYVHTAWTYIMWPLLIMKQSDGMETHRATDKLQYVCMYGCQVTIKGLSKLIGSYLKLVEEM